MNVAEIVSKYPRKGDQHSVWVVEDAESRTKIGMLAATGGQMKLLVCAHPQTSPEHAAFVASIWRIALQTEEGRKIIEQAAKEGF